MPSLVRQGGSRQQRRLIPSILAAAAVAFALLAGSYHNDRSRQRQITNDVRSPWLFVGASRHSRQQLLSSSLRRAEGAGAALALEDKPGVDKSLFNMNDIIDRTEYELIGSTFRLTSSVFGFPDFQSLIDLNGNGTVTYYAGMVSKEPGGWCVVKGDPKENESPQDLFLELTQPLTKRYMDSFLVPGGTCFWRGKLTFVKRDGEKKVYVEGGIVVSGRDEGKKMVREGVWTADTVGPAIAAGVRKRARQAFERAMTTPKAESTGFKTPARIAGAKGARPRKLLKAPSRYDEKDDLDLLEDGAKKKGRR
eukprot:TRINITY_DN6210_c0_g4_i1.p1 TRINITY_DN6210_c0_g4~~TRINITY_DN6210_c0_g4_i1.p1  ORF type:complete len:308 (-),score=56.47 TRINITY_DN6210_c0_g4_i1:207-1130(-)